MPNQLAKTKRRQSLAEHAAVLAALKAIADREAASPTHAETVRAVVWERAPRMPSRFKTPAQLARFKRAQREFDQVLLDLRIAAPAEVQARNSIVPSDRPIRLLNFANAHAASV
jgi:hypothetical protein